jgi:heme o synthase
VLAITAGHDVRGWLTIAAMVLAGQLSIGWGNDAIDAQRDRTAGRMDKPIATGQISRQAVANAASVALALCVPLSLAAGLTAGLVHLVAVGAAWAYNLGLKSTVVSPLPYAVAFGLVPVFVWLALPGEPLPPWWLVVAGALLGLGGHGANTLPDLMADKATGVNGLPQRLGAARTATLSAGCLTAAVFVLALGPSGRMSVVSWFALTLTSVLCVVAVRGASSGDRRSMYASLGVALIAVALFAAGGGAAA